VSEDASADAIGRIMGLTGAEARETLECMYGADIAGEVIGIGRIWNRAGLTRRERSLRPYLTST
jgi:hypothetical protein